MSNLTILFDAPIFALQLVVDGIMVGAIFALIAYGMALVWGVMNLINIAQGELVMLGGYIVYYLAAAGVPPLLGVPVAAVAMYLAGWALYRGFLFRIVDKDLFISILATFGLSILIQQLANQMFGANIRTVQSSLGSYYLAGGTLIVSQVKLVGFVMALVCGTALVLFLRRSRMGQAIRATAQNARAAKVLGIDTNRVYATTFAINGALCGAAGGLVAMTWIIHPYLGLTYTIRAFMIAVVAGVGNVAGVIFAGTGLGIAENLAGFLLGAEYQAAFVFSLLVVILVGRSLLLIRKRRVLR